MVVAENFELEPKFDSLELATPSSPVSTIASRITPIEVSWREHIQTLFLKVVSIPGAGVTSIVAFVTQRH